MYPGHPLAKHAMVRSDLCPLGLHPQPTPAQRRHSCIAPPQAGQRSWPGTLGCHAQVRRGAVGELAARRVASVSPQGTGRVTRVNCAGSVAPPACVVLCPQPGTQVGATDRWIQVPRAHPRRDSAVLPQASPHAPPPPPPTCLPPHVEAGWDGTGHDTGCPDHSHLLSGQGGSAGEGPRGCLPPAPWSCSLPWLSAPQGPQPVESSPLTLWKHSP